MYMYPNYEPISGNLCTKPNRRQFLSYTHTYLSLLPICSGLAKHYLVYMAVIFEPSSSRFYNVCMYL